MRYTCVLLVVMWVATAAGQSGTGSISGVVRDEGGRPVSHALVTAYLRSSAAGEARPVLKSGVSGADGSYSIGGLAVGAYLVCAQAEGRPLLDPCEWAERSPAWNLRAGEAARVEVGMARGVWMHFRVKDEERELERARAAKKKSYGIAVWTRRQALQHLEAGTSDAGGENRRIVVPRGAEVRYSVESSELEFSDGRGRAVSRGGREKVAVGSEEMVVELVARRRR